MLLCRDFDIICHSYCRFVIPAKACPAIRPACPALAGPAGRQVNRRGGNPIGSGHDKLNQIFIRNSRYNTARMKKLTEIFKEKNKTFSFELFPPKTQEGYEKLLCTIGELAKLKPDFISCTYGAGGGSRDKTLEIIKNIQDRHKIIGVHHLTCVIHTKDEIQTILNQIRGAGVNNILALRGDPPRDNPGWQPGANNFKYSSELCAFVRKLHGNYFGIGVAGFPEGHPLAGSREQDARFLKEKTDAGADFVITQLFFENKDYFDYVKRLRALGVTARIVPGVLPITDYKSLTKFCAVCGANVPQKIHDIFLPIQNEPEKVLKAGIDFAIAQCRELLAGGAPGIHFYALNKTHPVDVILQAIHH